MTRTNLAPCAPGFGASTEKLGLAIIERVCDGNALMKKKSNRPSQNGRHFGSRKLRLHTIERNRAYITCNVFLESKVHYFQIKTDRSLGLGIFRSIATSCDA